MCQPRGLSAGRRRAAAALTKGTPIHQFVDLAAFAEKMLLHERAVLKVADDIPLDCGALLGCAVTTGVGAALNTAQVAPGSTVAVFGAGGVGLSVIQGARIAGARQIIAVDLLDKKSRWRNTSAPPTRSTPRRATRSGRSKRLSEAASIIHSKRSAAGRSPSNAFTAWRLMARLRWWALFRRDKRWSSTPPISSSKRESRAVTWDLTVSGIDMPKYLEFYRQGRLTLTTW